VKAYFGTPSPDNAASAEIRKNPYKKIRRRLGPAADFCQLKQSITPSAGPVGAGKHPYPHDNKKAQADGKTVHFRNLVKKID